jgi:hypothetical protein
MLSLDMLLRLENTGKKVDLACHFTKFIDLAEALVNQDHTTYVLCTYIALLALRKELSKYLQAPKITDSVK